VKLLKLINSLVFIEEFILFLTDKLTLLLLIQLIIADSFPLFLVSF